MNSLLVLIWMAAAPGPLPQSSCISCHLEMGDELGAPVVPWRRGVHAERGIGCEGCHGGDPDMEVAEDPERAMDPAAGYRGVPDRQGVAEFCGSCHSSAEYMRQFNPSARIDQVLEYRTSRHGIRNAAGDSKTATCTDCHSVHGILPVRDPDSPVFDLRVVETCGKCHADPAYMAGRNLPTNQLLEYRNSVHGKALLEKRDTAAPACNDCHGNHGAAPPGIPSIAFVCGQCHARVAMLFRSSPKKGIFDGQGLGECTTCHGVHYIREPEDSMVGISEGSTCIACHEAEDEGGQTAMRFGEVISRLRERIEVADEILGRAERAGMEVSQTLFEVRAARSSLLNARVLVHSFQVDKVVASTSEGILVAEKAYEEGKEALRELQFRRKGLASSLIVILMVIAGLLWKIRQIGPPPEEMSPS